MDCLPDASGSPARWPRRFALAAALVLLAAAPAAAQGLSPGAPVRVTRQDGTTYEGRVAASGVRRPFQVMTLEGEARTIPLETIVRLTALDERLPVTPKWSTTRDTYAIFELVLVDGATSRVAMLQWASFDIDVGGRIQINNLWRSQFRSLEAVGGQATAAPPPAATPADFGFDARPAIESRTGDARPLEVTVLRDGSGTPEAGALVQVSNGTLSYLDVTGENGVATFIVPPGGLWRLRARSTTGRTGSAEADLRGAPDAAGEPSRAVVLVRR
ncbi:MAG: hypothetical protein AB7H88_18035 [Vicinamibacterales bacterium]